MAKIDDRNIYRRVNIKMWRGGSFSRLSPLEPSGQALWLVLLTHAEFTTALPCVVRGGKLGMAEALEWLPKRFEEGFLELFREGMVKADWKQRIIFLTHGLEENRPSNPNQVKAWGKAFQSLPECDLKYEIREAVKGFLEPFPEGFRKAFEEWFPERYRESREQGNRGTGEQEGEAPNVASCAEPHGSPPNDLIVLTFPVVSKPGNPQEWPLTKAKLREYRETYPHLDVIAEARRALQWIRDNPARRKTYRGMPKFLGGWLGRVQDSGNGARARTPPASAGLKPRVDYDEEVPCQ